MLQAGSSENKALDKGISLSSLSGSRNEGLESKMVKQGDNTRMHCGVSQCYRNRVFDSHGAAEKPYEMHINTIFLEQERKINLATSIFLQSKVPTGQNGNSPVLLGCTSGLSKCPCQGHPALVDHRSPGQKGRWG